MSAFGKQLKIYRNKTIDPQREKKPYRLTQARLAELLGDIISISDKEVSFWETGRRRIAYTDRTTLTRLIRILHEYNGIQTLDDANSFLQLGYYSSLSEEEIELINPFWISSSRKTRVNPGAYSRFYLGDSIFRRLENIFQWSQADEHASKSWAGMAIWSLSSITEQLTPNRLFAFFTFVLMWVLTIWTLRPIMQWPQKSTIVLRRAIYILLIAWFVMPLLIAIFTETNSIDGIIKDGKSKLTLFFLKFTGALVGFNLSVILLLILAIAWYYLTFPQVIWFWHIAVLLPLVIGIIGAKRIPADRIKMYEGTIKAHSADKWFLVAFLGTGPLIGVALLWGYQLLDNPSVGISFLLIVIGFILWHRQKHQPLSEPVLILILGVVIPLVIFSFLILSFLLKIHLFP